MTKCQRCFLPMPDIGSGYGALTCKCWAAYRSNPMPNDAVQNPPPGCQPLRQLTEADVRRIVRDEIGKQGGDKP